MNGASDLAIELTTLLRLLIAGVCGSVVGLQSELRQRPGASEPVNAIALQLQKRFASGTGEGL